MVMTDLSFLAVLRNESCMFCAGLPSISLSFESVVEQCRKLSASCGQPSPAGKLGVSGANQRYGERGTISTRARDMGRINYCKRNCFSFRHHAPATEPNLLWAVPASPLARK